MFVARVHKLAVVGAGTMGRGIVEVAARGGTTVTVVDRDSSVLERSRAALHSSLSLLSEQGRLDEQPEAVAERIQYSSNLEAVADCTVVIEAVIEDASVKTQLFAELDQLLLADAIIATNTSSIPIARLAGNTAHPERVVGLHFFNPVPRMPLVEVIPSLLTDPGVTAEIKTFAEEGLGKETVLCPDRAGFLVNAILVPYLLVAIRSLEAGISSRDEIDRAMVGGCGMPIGPLKLCDMIGLDTMLLVAQSLYAEHLDPIYAPPPLLRRHVDAGWFGLKSNHGFYTY